MTRKAKGKGFDLRSGNSPLEFKQMGSSPANMNNFGIGKGISPYKEDDKEYKDNWGSYRKTDTGWEYKKKGDENWSKATKTGGEAIEKKYGNQTKAEELKKKGEDYIDKIKGEDSSGDVIAEAGKGAKESGDEKLDKNSNESEEPVQPPEPEVKAKPDIGRKIKNTLIAGITGGLDAVYGTGKVIAAGDSVKFYDSDKHKDDTEEKTTSQKIIEGK